MLWFIYSVGELEDEEEVQEKHKPKGNEPKTMTWSLGCGSRPYHYSNSRLIYNATLTGPDLHYNESKTQLNTLTRDTHPDRQSKT